MKFKNKKCGDRDLTIKTRHGDRIRVYAPQALDVTPEFLIEVREGKKEAWAFIDVKTARKLAKAILRETENHD